MAQRSILAKNRRFGGCAIAKSSGGFFFIWTLLALGVTALFSVVLCVCGLRRLMPWRAAAQQR